MKNIIRGVVLSIVLACFPSLFAVADPVVIPTVTPVTGQGFVADFYSSPGSEKKIGILALGGAEGGMPTVWARAFAQAGYPVLGVGYFKVEGRPDTLEEIALEYFDKTIAWLMAGNRVRPGGIVVAGASKGAELALLLASRKKEIIGVIVLAPSSVVWQATPQPGPGMPQAKSSWTEGGKQLAFVPFDNGSASGSFSLLQMHQHSLFNLAAAQAAAIPVERINGPVLLLSGEDDRIWPSSEMGEAVIARLKAKGFRFPFQHIIYPAAGHTLDDKPNEQYPYGGTVEGNRQAHLDSWKKIFDFLAGLEARS